MSVSPNRIPLSTRYEVVTNSVSHYHDNTVLTV